MCDVHTHTHTHMHMHTHKINVHSYTHTYVRTYVLLDPAADREASEMLTDNAQNLMKAVSEVLFATEAATIRVSPEVRDTLGLQWVKRSH